MDQLVLYKLIGKDGEWTHNPELPRGAKRRRIDRAQARVASPPREPEPVQEDQPPNDDVDMDEAHSPPAPSHIPVPPPQPPAVDQIPSDFMERFERLETTQMRLFAEVRQMTEMQTQILAYQRQNSVYQTTVHKTQNMLLQGQTQLIDDFSVFRSQSSEFRSQAVRAQDWAQGALSALLEHAQIDYPPPPSGAGREDGPSRPSGAATSDSIERMFGPDGDANDDGAS